MYFWKHSSIYFGMNPGQKFMMPLIILYNIIYCVYESDIPIYPKYLHSILEFPIHMYILLYQIFRKILLNTGMVINCGRNWCKGNIIENNRHNLSRYLIVYFCNYIYTPIIYCYFSCRSRWSGTLYISLCRSLSILSRYMYPPEQEHNSIFSHMYFHCFHLFGWRFLTGLFFLF